jgi:hypothetical protein
MLVNWGIDEAKRLGMPAYLETTPKGRPLYERCGFAVVDHLVTDFSPWDGPAVEKTPLMLYDPRA